MNTTTEVVGVSDTLCTAYRSEQGLLTESRAGGLAGPFSTSEGN